MLSSSISPSIGNLQKLTELRLYDNRFTGELPSHLGSLSRLRILNLSKNKFSGTIPQSFKSLESAERIDLFETDLEGEVPDNMCEIEPLPSITADCRNDIFPPDLSCSCCSYCSDKTPVWDGECPDMQLKFNIDHVEFGSWFSTELLQWSITDTTTNRKLIGDGPYIRGLTLKPSYETCVASSDCLILNMMVADPLIEERMNANNADIDFNTNYSIYWDDKLVLQDTFETDIYNQTVLPQVSFHYDESTDQIHVGSSCAKKELICSGEPVLLKPVQRVMYNTAFKVSGTDAFNDVDSPHQEALCWIIDDVSMYNDTDIIQIETLFTQRHVLTLLHLTSASGLFGDSTLPPSSNECLWKGVQCSNDTKTMTSLSLEKQIIGNTLIEEISKLEFLEYLNLSQTKLKGTIPRTFSNLYSLKEFDLSANDFFNQLSRLESLDLSDNDMTGVIPANIGSYSDIKTIRLNYNRFTGELPLDGFSKFNLKYLDVSENKLSGIISPSLLKHTNIEYLNIGENFLVGSLLENIFDELINLRYFNVSKNELTGIIPPLPNKNSNITHFDMHANQFTGTLPVFSGMVSVRHLNLQGNKITGSIPFDLNQLENLHTLALSMEGLFLQSNQLSGKAPVTSKEMKDYITDCGYPSLFFEPMDCPSCNVCCNSEDLCSKQNQRIMRPAIFAGIFFFSLIVLLSFIYATKEKLMKTDIIVSRFEQSFMFWNASMMIGDKSVYHFFLTHSAKGWYVGLFCAIAQLATLFVFVNAADIASKGSDLKYTMTCSANSLECDDERSRSPFGGLIFTLILFGWLSRDLVGSIKLFMLSLWKKNIDFFFASMILFLVTALSAWTSVYYNLAIAKKDTELIVNAVILLFVNELDERLFLLCQMLELSFTSAVEESLERDSFHEDQKLNVSRGVNKMKKRLHALGSSVSSSIRPRRRRSSDLHIENLDIDIINLEKNDQVSEGDESEDLEKENK